MVRGRPPYDDILTPREWDVLHLMCKGLTNEQTGKFRPRLVDQALRKLTADS